MLGEAVEVADEEAHSEEAQREDSCVASEEAGR